MGTSTIQFRNCQYRSSDDAMAVWLALLVREIDAQCDVSDWLREARDEWHLQATAGFGFGVMPALDRLVTDEERRETVLAVSQRALARLESLGPMLPQDALNALGTGGEGVVFDQDVPAEPFVETARRFIQLLAGTLA